MSKLNASNLEKYNFIEIDKKNYNLTLDIVYATDNNFFQQKVYHNYIPILHKEAAEKLLKASKLAKQMGYKIKFFDGFRPLEVQVEFFKFFNDERYVTNPITGIASHCRGIAIDVTLVDEKTGKDLDMGTRFDDMTEKSHHNNFEISQEAQRNRSILAGIMHIAGFEKFETEWWHYQLPNYSAYPKISQKELDLKILDQTKLKQK